jgi:hypothetical protein
VQLLDGKLNSHQFGAFDACSSSSSSVQFQEHQQQLQNLAAALLLSAYTSFSRHFYLCVSEVSQ